MICLDNLFTGSEQNIALFRSNPDFEFVLHDIVNPYEATDIDEIYNLACPASPVHYQYDAIKTIKTAVMGVINMLDLARFSRHPPAKYMATRWYIPKTRTIGETSTQ